MSTGTSFMSSLVRFSMAALLAGLSPFVGAQGFEAVRLAPLPPGQDGGRAGVFFIAGTAYRGSEERRNLLLPAIDYQWANGWFAGMAFNQLLGDARESVLTRRSASLTGVAGLAYAF